MTTTVLIAGAGIAGPALAHCLHHHGFEVTVIERSPAQRPGGQAVDLRGVAREVVRRMGLEAQVMAARTNTRGMTFVNSKNKPIGVMRADMSGGDGFIAEIEILRGDLAEVLYRATERDAEYIFGDYITALEQHSDGVDVGFASGDQRTFDLVIGADGLHSPLRAMVFGPESDFVHDLDQLMGFFTVPNRLGLENWMLTYLEPKRSAAIRPVRDNTEALALLSMPGTRNDCDYRDVAGQKALFRQRLADMGWEVSWLLDQMDNADDFYFDSASQVRMDSWSRGRVALLGDAAFCSAPSSGQGTSLAVVGAYILAGELAASAGDHTVAFREYERRMRDWVASTQKLGLDNIKQFAVNTKFELWVQHQLLRIMTHLPGGEVLTRRLMKVVDDIDLPDYPDQASAHDGKPSKDTAI